MVVFKQYGWLGNQIFQYCALRSMMKDSETLLMVGCHQFDHLFENKKAIFVNKYTGSAKKVFFKKFTKLTEQWAKKGLIQSIHEDEEQNLVYERGTFNKISFSHLFFQQKEHAFNPKYFFNLSIRPEYIKKAREIIEKIKVKSSPLYFIHIRRGEYLEWKSPDFPAVLPLSYYKHCIHLIRNEHKNARFIICSDDKDYAKKHFAGKNHIYLSEERYQTDFALMRECDGGILSASSFSWWAAFFLHHHGASGPFYAPEYWISHRENVWYPKHIRSSFLSYINVEEIGYSDE